MNSKFHCHNESRFVRRHNNLLDTSKPTNVSSKNVNEIHSREEAPADFTHDSSELQRITDQRISIGGDSSIELSSEDTYFNLPQPLKYYNSGGSPEDFPLLGIDETNSLFESLDEPTPDVAYVRCDWNNLITDDSDPFIYSPPTVTHALMGLVNKRVDPTTCLSNSGTLLPQSTADNDRKMLVGNPVASGSVHEIEDHPSEPIAATNTGQTHVNLANVAFMAGNPIETMAHEKHMTNRGTRRRCLDFEMASVQRNINNSGDGSNINSNTTKSDERNIGNEMSLLPRRYTRDSRMCVLSGNIGLHMNPLATFNTNINNEMMMPSGWKSTLPSFTSSLHQERPLLRVPALFGLHMNPLATCNTNINNEMMMSSGWKSTLPSFTSSLHQERPLSRVPALFGLHMNPLATFNTDINNEMMMSSGWKSTLPSFTSSLHQERPLSRVPALMERDLVPSENKVQPIEDCTQSTVCLAAEDFHQKNPKKRRHKSEPAREGEACHRCNCRKSKCLKLYCECFSAGIYCTEPCCCQDCFNKSINDDVIRKTRKQIVSRNPFAFTPKVIRSSDSLAEIGDDPTKTPASARHKRGCNCKKSSCLKRYCECFQGGVGCSINCRCEGCKNEYGRKDVSAPAEIKAESEEAEACEKGRVEKASQKTEIQNIEGHPDCAFPTRPSLPLPFSSKGKPPRSFNDTISGSGLFASQRLENLGSQSNSEKLFQTVTDDNIPVTSITTSSPNSKRISTPKRDIGSSPTS